MRVLVDAAHYEEMSMKDTPSRDDHKHTALEFLELVVAGNIDEAYEKYVDMQGKHHNPFFAAGFPALKKAMIENHTQMPEKRITVQNALAEGDRVAVHSELILTPGGDRMAVVHIFRFGNNKIVEMWDCGQQVPADSPNTDGAF
jgi:predicted SnoaL-like aldol condensation-catalyzing enzyme